MPIARKDCLMKRTLIVNGHKYTVAERPQDKLLVVVGPGIRQWPYLLLEGLSIDDLRRVRVEVQAYLKKKRERRAELLRRAAQKETT